MRGQMEEKYLESGIETWLSVRENKVNHNSNKAQEDGEMD